MSIGSWENPLMRFKMSELAVALGAELTGPAVPLVEGLATDSRRVRPGQLFAALTADRDGHDFVDAAVESGASAVLVERPVDGVACLVVPDVTAALASLAVMARSAMPDRVVGITGSVGKTTTKDILAGLLGTRFVTAASERSFNNELGVPLTLCNAADDVQAVVVEMGARGVGHIRHLCDLADPTVGVITTVQAVHTEVMGDEAQIAAAKGELVEALPADGLAVLNASVPLVAALAARTPARVLRFGRGGDVTAERVELNSELHPRFELRSPWGSRSVELGVRGLHNVDNALAAVTVALALDVALDDAVTALADAATSPWRMELSVAESGARILNDAYNASPASMDAALWALSSLPARRRFAVLGEMAELGERSTEEHRRVAATAADLGIVVVAVGTDMYGVEPVDSNDDAGLVDAAVEALGSLGEDDVVLVKASRFVGLERVAEALLD